MIPYNFMAIEGNIGAGKTSLATMISEKFNARLILEQFEDNSFLPKFYKDPERYAFPLELSFLADRFQQLKKHLHSHDLFSSFTVADYFINKSLIFARKTLSPDEFALYQKLFSIMSLTLPRPDLLVYLYMNLTRLRDNIVSRGRPYEQSITEEYLEKIQNSYLDFIREQPNLRVIIIDTNKVDFVHNSLDFELLLEIISSHYDVGVHRIRAK